MANALPANAAPRWRESSPWWPLVLWLGVPTTLCNLGVACWQVLHVHLLIQSTAGGGVPGAVFWIEAIQLGTIVGMLLVLVQLSLASLLLVCGPGNLSQRLLVFWLVVAWISGCILMSTVLARWLGLWLQSFNNIYGGLLHDAYSSISGFDGLRAAGALPALMLGFQAPLWLGRIVLGWRLVRVGSNSLVTENAPCESLSIRDLMIGTAIVAVSLGFLQFADRLTVSSELGTERSYLFGVLGVSLFLVVVEFIGAIPLTILILRRQSLLFAWIAIAAYAVGIPLILLLLGLMAGAQGQYGLLLLFHCSGVLPLLALYAGGLGLLRRYGWQLERHPRRPIKVTQSMETPHGVST